MTDQNLAALIILDGFGLREEEKGNAVKQAHTPILTAFGSNTRTPSCRQAGKQSACRRGKWAIRKLVTSISVPEELYTKV